MNSIICRNKMPTRCNRWIFIADLIACSTCFGQLYAHHQELESTIQVDAACCIWCLVFKLSVQCGIEGCVSGLRAAAAARKPDTSIVPYLILCYSSVKWGWGGGDDQTCSSKTFQCIWNTRATNKSKKQKICKSNCLFSVSCAEQRPCS
jgi:hypothetical protein